MLLPGGAGLKAPSLKFLKGLYSARVHRLLYYELYLGLNLRLSLGVGGTQQAS